MIHFSTDATFSKPPSAPKLAGLEKVASVLQVIIYIVAALALLYFIIRHLSNFSTWAQGLLAAIQAFWQRLFGGSVTTAAGGAGEEAVPKAVYRRPFSSFENPFIGGRPDRSPEELVLHSFAAM